MDERKVERELALEHARRGELARRIVEPDDARAAPREPCRPVGRSAPELDHVAAVDRRQGGDLVPHVISWLAHGRRPIAIHSAAFASQTARLRAT